MATATKRQRQQVSLEEALAPLAENGTAGSSSVQEQQQQSIQDLAKYSYPRAVNRKPEKGGTFRVVRNAHIGDGPPGCDCDNCVASKGKNHVYTSYGTYARLQAQQGKTMWKETGEFDPDKHFLPPNIYEGDIIESDIDLCARLNGRDKSGQPLIKFERVHGQGEAPEPPSFSLEKMNLPQLLAHAQELGIDVDAIESKEAAIQAIREYSPSGRSEKSN